MKTAPLQADIAMPHGYRYLRTTWEEHLKICSGYNYMQTPEELASRGGFGILEAHMYYGWEKPIVLASFDNVSWDKYEIVFREGIQEWNKIA